MTRIFPSDDSSPPNWSGTWFVLTWQCGTAGEDWTEDFAASSDGRRKKRWSLQTGDVVICCDQSAELVWPKEAREMGIQTGSQYSAETFKCAGNRHIKPYTARSIHNMFVCSVVLLAITADELSSRLRTAHQGLPHTAGAATGAHWCPRV